MSLVAVWLNIVFASFGSYALGMQPSFALFLGESAVTGAIFLIMELYTPFEGWIRIPSPLRSALEEHGK